MNSTENANPYSTKSGESLDRPPSRRVPLNRAVVFALLAILGGGADLWTKEVVFRWRGMPGESDIWWLIDGYVGSKRQ